RARSRDVDTLDGGDPNRDVAAARRTVRTVRPADAGDDREAAPIAPTPARGCRRCSSFHEDQELPPLRGGICSSEQSVSLRRHLRNRVRYDAELRRTSLRQRQADLRAAAPVDEM